MLQVAGDPEVETEAADQRAPVARVNVEAPAREHALLGKERHAVLEVDLEREQLPCGIRQGVDGVEEWSLGIQPRLAVGVAPDDATYPAPVARAGVHLPQDLGKGNEAFTDDTEIDFRE